MDSKYCSPVQAADVCPTCGHKGLTYGDSELADESYIYDWTCPNCGQAGKECHNLVFSEHILA